MNEETRVGIEDLLKNRSLKNEILIAENEKLLKSVHTESTAAREMNAETAKELAKIQKQLESNFCPR